MVMGIVVLICVIGVTLIAAVAVGLMLIARAGEQDPVSSAREDWITRRSDGDDRGW